MTTFEPCAVCGVQVGADGHAFHEPDCYVNGGKRRYCLCDGWVHLDCCDHCGAVWPPAEAERPVMGQLTMEETA